MAAKNAKGSLGGRNAQKGFLYQNSIAASHLFELLIGADRVWRVTTETLFPVDDILVERRDSIASYYQVKCYEGVSEWTLNRLITSGILEQFRKQFTSSGPRSRFILSSPVPTGSVHDCADEARRCDSPQQLSRESLPERQREICAELADLLGSEVQVYRFLRSYYEEPWPPSPEHIRDICLGRYRGSPYAAVTGIWSDLLGIVAREAMRGRPLKRADLLDLLDERLSVGEAAKLGRNDINVTRHTAKPAWYVPRDEEFDLLSATYDLLSRTPRNLLVMGDGGTGKSSFFAWMRREIEKDSRLSVVALTAECGDSLELIDTISNALRASLNGMEPERGTIHSRIDRLIWYMQQTERANRFLVIAVDHFESLFSSIFVSQSRDKIAQARYSIVEAIARARECTNVMWVLLARSEYFFLMFPNDDSLHALNMSWVRIQDFSDKQAEQLLGKLARIADVKLSDDATRVFLSNAPRNPLKLILTFLNLHSALPADLITGEAVLRLQPWADVFQQDFNSLDDAEAQVVYAVASLMATTARRTFTFEEIQANLPSAEAQRPSPDALRDVLHRIQETTRLLQQPIPGRYALYHENFASYVISRYGGRIRTPESVRQFEDFMVIFKHQTRARLQALFSEVSRLAHLEGLEDQGPGTAKRRREVIERLEDTLQLYSNQFRSAELFARRDQRIAQDVVAKERLSLTRLIMSVVRHHSHRAAKRNGEIRVDLPHEELVIYGDQGMLSTALSNVIDNAVQYSVRGQPVLVRARNEGRFCVVEVSNVGIGIRPEDGGKIFQPYYRGPVSDPRRFVAGTGIGLSVTKSIIDALSGSIGFGSNPFPESSSNRGNSLVTFVLRLPRAATISGSDQRKPLISGDKRVK